MRLPVLFVLFVVSVLCQAEDISVTEFKLRDKTTIIARRVGQMVANGETVYFITDLDGKKITIHSSEILTHAPNNVDIDTLSLRQAKLIRDDSHVAPGAPAQPAPTEQQPLNNEEANTLKMIRTQKAGTIYWQAHNAIDSKFTEYLSAWRRKSSALALLRLSDFGNEGLDAAGLSKIEAQKLKFKANAAAQDVILEKIEKEIAPLFETYRTARAAYGAVLPPGEKLPEDSFQTNQY